MAFRDGPFENLKVPLAWTAAVVVVVGLVAAGVLVLSDRRTVSTTENYSAVRAGFDTAAAPVGGVLSAPVRWFRGVGDGIGGYFFAVSENRRLKKQVTELQDWRNDAIALKNINARYETMLGIRTEPAIPMATARAISDSRGAFINARLIDAGASKGVRIGNPVINEHGLVGRVVGVTADASRMVLVNDVASRIPVLIDRTDARALMTGDGSGNPRLEFVRGVGSVQAGDRILSSGDGGGLPRGMPIGVAAKGVDGSWRVKLYSDKGAIDFVRVLLFQDFGQLINPDALNTVPLTGLTTAPAPNAVQAAAIQDAATRRAAAAAAAAAATRQREIDAQTQAAALARAQQAQAQALAAANAQAAAATPANSPATTPAPRAAAPRPVAPRPAQPRPAAPAAAQPTPEAAPGGQE